MELEDLEALALEGNVELQYKIGVLYELGKDVKKDYDKALKFLLLAAKNGNDNAQCELGKMYCTGEGVDLDYKEGFKWFSMASNQNNSFAQGNLGLMYENGYGVQKDYSMAFKYYMMAANNGNSIAQSTVANMYKNGIGVEQNIIESEKWLKIAENKDVDINKKKESSSTLNENLYDKILNCCNIGDKLVEEGKYYDGINRYMEALEYVPDPKENWEVSTWIYAAIGDAYFSINKYNESQNNFLDALNCPKGIDNPFIYLRVGQCFYKLNNIKRAEEFFIKAYMLGGNDIFKDEGDEYFKIIKKLI